MAALGPTRVFPSRLRLPLVSGGTPPVTDGGCGFGSRGLWTQGRVARFKLWPLRRLLALETPLEKATAPPFWSEIALAVCPGTWARLPALETQRELVPRPYLLALRRGEAARFKEQPALWLPPDDRPRTDFFPFLSQTFFCFAFLASSHLGGWLAGNVCCAKSKKLRTTLNGGSLGSCVDEERS